jgi:hypothetical protein
MSSTIASFEVLPFRTDSEAQSEEVGRRMGGISPRLPGAIGPRRGIYQGPYRPHRGLRRPIGGYDQVAVQASAAPDDTQAPAGGAAASEQIRWVQFALNQIQNANLPTDGFASPDLRAALRDFQSRNGLPASGFVGPDTIAALKTFSGSLARTRRMDEEFELSPGEAAEIYEKLKMGNKKNLMDFAEFSTTIGVYRITWGTNGNYVGKATTLSRSPSNEGLRKRLKDHITEVGQLGYTPNDRQVTYVEMPGRSPKDVEKAEKAIRALARREPGNTNQRELTFSEFDLY